MKRIVIAILLLAICLSSLFILSSCGKKNAGSTVVLFSDEGLLCVERNDKWGYINKEGQEVIPCKYYRATSFQNGCAVVQENKDEAYYYIKSDGTRLLETPFYEAEDFDSKERAIVKKSEKGKYELIDKKGKNYFTAEAIRSGDNGLYLFKGESGMWGIADKNGKTILEAKYDGVWFIKEFDNGSDYYRWPGSALTDRFIAFRESSSGGVGYLIDSKGKELYTMQVADYFEYNLELYTLRFDGESFGICVDGTIPVFYDDDDDDDNGTVLLDYDGKVINKISAGDIEFVCQKGFLCEYEDNDYERFIMVDWKGNILFDPYVKGYDGLYGINWDGDLVFSTEDYQCGVFDANKGEVLINPEYYGLSNVGFDGNGLCIGQKEENGPFVAINRKGETVFSKSCDNLVWFRNSNAPYYVAAYEQGENTSYELVNAKGEMVHTFGLQYSPVAFFDDGYIVCNKIENGEIVGYVVFNGKFEQITSIVYDSINR